MVLKAHTMTLYCSDNKIILILETNYYWKQKQKHTIFSAIVRKSV